jgi:hypothetical protein
VQNGIQKVLEVYNNNKPVQLPHMSLACSHQQAYFPFLPCLVGEADLSFETVDLRQQVADADAVAGYCFAVVIDDVDAAAAVREQVSSTTQNICIRACCRK